MPARIGKDEFESGRNGSPREDGLYSERGRGGDVSGDFADPKSQDLNPSPSRSNGRGHDVSKTPWFDPIDDFGECKDGICPVSWAVASDSTLSNPVFTIPGRPKVLEDVVNHPSHYTDGGIECIEAIEAQLTLEEFKGYLKGNVAKYIWRERHKGGLESLKKAQWYLDRLIGTEEINQTA